MNFLSQLHRQMSLQGSSTTPTRTSIISPLHWLRHFAYTPDSARVDRDGDSLPSRSTLAEENGRPVSNEDTDALPTRFHTRDRSPSPARDLPATRAASSSQKHAKKIRTRRKGGRGRRQDPAPSHAPPRSTRLRSRRVILDAVEIVVKRRRRSRLDGPVDPGIVDKGRMEGARSPYPCPPLSRTPGDDAALAGPLAPSADGLRPNAVAEAGASLELTPPRTTSKYFACAPAELTRPASANSPVLAPPESPVLSIPVYIESSDFEHPPLDSSLNEPAQGGAQSRQWYDDPGLFNDLMIMLRRLKPILVQECVQDDPWKVLVAVRLLNVTTGKAALPVFHQILFRWRTPEDLARADLVELVELLRPLGLYNQRAQWLCDMSKRFVGDLRALGCTPTGLASRLCGRGDAPGLRYPGVGAYAQDSLRIFCTGEDAWKDVMPRDKELVRYLRWRWAVEEGKVWYPDGRGVLGDADVPYLITLVDELAVHYDGAIGGEGYMWHFRNDVAEVLGRAQGGEVGL